MPILGSGRFHWRKSPRNLRCSSLPLVDTILIDYRLVSQVPRNTSSNRWSPSWLGYKECCVTSMMCSSLAEASKSIMPRLHTVLQRIQAAGVTLNQKCQFSKDCMTFLGHLINKDGVSPDPLKTTATERMEKPKTTTEL